MALYDEVGCSEMPCRIFLGNLNAELDESVIGNYCSGWGELEECRLMVDNKDLTGRGFAYIQFRTINSTEHFLSNCPHYIGDRRIEVRRLAADTENTSEVKSALQSSKRVLVSFFNSEKEMPKIKFHEFFSKYDVINDIITHSVENKVGKTFSGYAIIQFVDTEGATKCCDSGAQHIVEETVVNVRRIVSGEGVAKRKHEMSVEEAIYNNARKRVFDEACDMSRTLEHTIDTEGNSKEYASSAVMFSSAPTKRMFFR